MGNRGWLKTPNPLKHPEAAKNQGRIFCAAEDVLGGQTLKKGDRVGFKVFVNKMGLRADAVKKVGDAAGTMPHKHGLPPIRGSAALSMGVKKTIQKQGQSSKPKPPSGPPPKFIKN